MGKRKINIGFIETPKKRHDYSRKRRGGLFNKTYELSELCGQPICLIVGGLDGYCYFYADDQRSRENPQSGFIGSIIDYVRKNWKEQWKIYDPYTKQFNSGDIGSVGEGERGGERRRWDGECGHEERRGDGTEDAPQEEKPNASAQVTDGLEAKAGGMRVQDKRTEPFHQGPPASIRLESSETQQGQEMQKPSSLETRQGCEMLHRENLGIDVPLLSDIQQGNEMDDPMFSEMQCAYEMELALEIQQTQDPLPSEIPQGNDMQEIQEFDENLKPIDLGIEPPTPWHIEQGNDMQEIQDFDENLKPIDLGIEPPTPWNIEQGNDMQEIQEFDENLKPIYLGIEPPTPWNIEQEQETIISEIPGDIQQGYEGAAADTFWHSELR